MTDRKHQAEQRRAGRPPLGDRAQTAAERQRAYRRRQRRAEIDAIGAEAEASRVTLLRLLAGSLATLDDGTAKRRHPPSRSAAQRVVAELVRRYGLG